jgi:hypothetical protein
MQTVAREANNNDNANRHNPLVCVEPECSECAIVDCPGREPMHNHHDGCPYCVRMALLPDEL